MQNMNKEMIVYSKFLISYTKFQVPDEVEKIVAKGIKIYSMIEKYGL